MIKRVNSTGRKRIPREYVAIEIFDGSPRTFNATIDLGNFSAPKEAEVVLEATCAGSNVVRRFEWGTVDKLCEPRDRTLADLHGRNIFFSLKVIDRSERIGRILGFAGNIRPIKGGEKSSAGRRGLLPVEPSEELGDELWKLDFRAEGVYLLYNKSLPGLDDRMRFDAAIYALIYPSIIRQILNRSFDEADDDDAEPNEHWPSLWLRFAKQLHPEKLPPPELESDREEWIDEVVNQFCREHLLKSRFVQAAGQGLGEEEAS